MKPLVILNCVGLSPRHIGAQTPRMQALAAHHGVRPLEGVVPAVTLPAQATILTGLLPSRHGIVGNGWLFRDTNEIRFWQQSRTLLQGRTLYEDARAAARERGEPFSCAKMFWWFNQGAAVEYSVTPKPWYGCDGDKRFGIYGTPEGLCGDLETALGAFPFHTFWGPMAGLPCSRWIADATAHVLRTRRPTLTLAYLPHLDYDLQRFGDAPPHLPRLLAELDACVGTLLDAAAERGASTILLSEYGIRDVTRPVPLNRILRRHGYLAVRDGPFGEHLDTFGSRAFAVCDHQLAHVHVRDAADREAVAACLAETEGVEAVWGETEKAAHGLDHPRAGELVAVAAPDAWFPYYYWLEESCAPDFAPTIDIHRKPGYDPAELFFDRDRFVFPKAAAAWRVLRKKLGFRMRFDVVPTHGEGVRGSHGRVPDTPADGAVFLTDAILPPASAHPHMTDIKAYALRVMEIPPAST